MAELLAQTEDKSVVGSLDNFRGAKSFVDDIRRLRFVVLILALYGLSNKIIAMEKQIKERQNALW
jgi:hypothetical protein